VHLNRVRHRGRGWVIAGFEMVLDEEDAGAGKITDDVRPPPIPKAPLELAEWPEGHAR